MYDLGNVALVSIHGTNMKCEIRFDKKSFLHKFKS